MFYGAVPSSRLPEWGLANELRRGSYGPSDPGGAPVHRGQPSFTIPPFLASWRLERSGRENLIRCRIRVAGRRRRCSVDQASRDPHRDTRGFIGEDWLTQRRKDAKGAGVRQVLALRRAGEVDQGNPCRPIPGLREKSSMSVPARTPTPAAGLKTSPFQACRLLARIAALAPPRRLGRARQCGAERVLPRWKKEEGLAPMFEEDAATALSFAGLQTGRFRGIPARH